MFTLVAIHKFSILLQAELMTSSGVREGFDLKVKNPEGNQRVEDRYDKD